MKRLTLMLAIVAAVTLLLAQSREMPPARPEPYGRTIIDRAFGATP